MLAVRLIAAHARKKIISADARVYDFLSESSEEPIRSLGVEKLDVRDGEHVLEIGFGTGTSLVELASMVGPHGSIGSWVARGADEPQALASGLG